MVGNQSFDHLKVLYLGDCGDSVVADAHWAAKSEANASFYPIKTAVTMSMAEQMLVGRSPVLVHGVWSQIYLQLIQAYLFQTKKYPSTRNIVFIPVASPTDIASLVRLMDQPIGLLPYVILDGTDQDQAQDLQRSLYKDGADRVITLNELQTVEDLLPANELARQFTRLYRGMKTDDFDYILLPDQPIVGQIRTFTEANAYTLSDDWRLTLAQRVATAFDKLIPRLQPERVQQWVTLFQKLL